MATRRGKPAGPWFGRAAWAALASLLALAGTPLAAAADTQIWLMSTRELSNCGEEARPDCWRWSGDDWQDVDQAAFCSTDVHLPVLVFVHGNRFTAQDAVDDGWRAAERVRALAEGRPFRFLIWSWPADKVYRRSRPDVQLKAGRSDAECFYLGRLLNRMSPKTPVCLLGYSFGARAITGALHLAAGGSLGGRSLAEQPLAHRRPLRAMLIAPAENADWLAPGHCHGLATTQVDQALVTLNTCDRYLKFYRHLYRLHGPPALGAVGPQCLSADDDATAKLQVLDVSCAAGREHGWDHYFPVPELQALIPWYARLDGGP